MRGGLIGVLALLAFTGVAWAGDAATVGESKLAGYKFPTPATKVDDDGTFRKALDEVADQVHLKCGAVEAFGWTYDDPQKGQPMVDATIKAMTASGYAIKAIDYKPFAGRQAFPGLATGKKKQIVLIWVAEATDATLALCEATAEKTEPAKKDAEKKK